MVTPPSSMSMIAARLGGSKGTLYNYFENKKALFTAYIEDTCQRFGDEIFGAWTDDSSPLRPALKSLSRSGISNTSPARRHRPHLPPRGG